MRILVADDDRMTTMMLSRTLERWGFEVVVAQDGAAAWEHIVGDRAPALAIIDWMMPGVEGPELCRRIRRDPRLSGMHVILLTSRTGRADIVAGLEAGADDYVAKPFDIEELRARVHVGVRVVELQDRLAAEVSALQTARTDLERLANTDSLTNLASRRYWFTRADRELGRCRRHGRPLAVLMADLDHFKNVNDTFGHGVGDLVLAAFAKLLQGTARGSDLAARVGGEEFALLLPEASAAGAADVARRIVDGCRAMRVAAPEDTVRITCSVGVAEVHSSDETIDGAMRRADAALYLAKDKGRDRVVVDSAEVRTADGPTTHSVHG